MTRASHTAAHAATEGGTLAAIVPFTFRGDVLDVVPSATAVHVVIRRVCEALGIAFQPQLAKLSGDPSVTITMIVTVAEDGKRREVACLDVRALPLWLATIHPSKVKPAAREKLITYRRECADVLADHFLGKRGDGQMTAVLARMVDAITASNALLSRRLDIVEARVSAVTALPANNGEGIGAAAAERHILSPLRKVARLKAAAIHHASDPSALRRLRLTEERSLRRELNYQMDKRQAWAKFPPERLTEAKNAIERIVGMAEDLARLAGVASPDTSGPLFAKFADPRNVN